MKIAVRYFSRGGNTKKLADAIAAAVGVEAEDVSVPLLEKVDVLFLGSSVYAYGVDTAVKHFLEDNAIRIGKLVNFSTAALVSGTYPQISKLAEQNDIPLSEQEFHCRGSFAMLHRGRPNAQDTAAAADFARQVLSL
jgi:flavodoxin